MLTKKLCGSRSKPLPMFPPTVMCVWLSGPRRISCAGFSLPPRRTVMVDATSGRPVEVYPTHWREWSPGAHEALKLLLASATSWIVPGASRTCIVPVGSSIRHGPQRRRTPQRIKLIALSARDAAARDAQARTIVDKWNVELAAGKRPQFSPTLEAAFRARRPWLRLHCPGCDQVYEIDLRKIVRPQDFPIMALRAALVCESICRGQGPQPRLLALAAAPEQLQNAKAP